MPESIVPVCTNPDPPDAGPVHSFAAFRRSAAEPDGGRRIEAGLCKEVRPMLKWALIFFIISIVAGVFGFGGISAGAADIAKILFYIFVVIFVIFLILGVMAGKAVT